MKYKCQIGENDCCNTCKHKDETGRKAAERCINCAKAECSIEGPGSCEDCQWEAEK